MCAVVEDHNQRLEFLGDAVTLIHDPNVFLRPRSIVHRDLSGARVHHDAPSLRPLPVRVRGEAHGPPLRPHQQQGDADAAPLSLVSLCRRRCSRSPHPLAISTQALRYFASRLGLQCLLLTSGLTPLVRHSHPPRGARRPSLSERLADFDRASRGSTRTRTRIRCSPTASSLCSAPCTSTRSIHPLSLLAVIFSRLGLLGLGYRAVPGPPRALRLLVATRAAATSAVARRWLAAV